VLSTTERVLQYVRHSVGVERGQLARELDLPAPTVVSAVRRLLATGALVEDLLPRGPSGRGRPAAMLRAAGPAPLLGLIGWTDGRVEATCLRFDGSPVATAVTTAPRPVTAPGDLDQPMAALRDLAATEAGHELRAVVVSAPAPLLAGGRDPAAAGGGAFAVVPARNFEPDLARRHGIPVYAENDANLAALGEHRAAGGRSDDHFVYLKIHSGGFGSAIVVDGRVIRGARGFAGELAHVQISDSGPLCICGGRGCLRTQVNQLVSDTAQAAYATPITFADLPRLALAGDAGAARMLHDIGRAIGRPLVQLCTFLDPERIVVDNSIGPAVGHLTAGLRTALATMAPPAISDQIAIVVSDLGPAAEYRGAVELVRDHARTGRTRTPLS
jgi:predicted NBD/HSP70 family sugar kinase